MEPRDLLTDLGLPAPAHLDLLLQWLAEAGHAPVDPADRLEHHPLVVPLAARTPEGGAHEVVGLLFWPAAPSQPNVVRQGEHLELLASSVDALLQAEMARRDAAGRPLGALEAAAPELYETTTVAQSGLPIDLWLLRHGRVPHTFFEPLIARHLARGDTESARITADRACRADVGWARPHARRARLLEGLGLVEQARDSARLALMEPVWTLGEPFPPIARLAGWNDPIDGEPYRRLAADPERSATDRAAHRMDAAAVDGEGWTAIRDELAALYRSDDQEPVARLVAG